MNAHTQFAQSLVDGMDKSTEDGFAEALMICIASLTDAKGKLLNIRLGINIEQQIDFSRQIAKMMLHGEKV